MGIAMLYLMADSFSICYLGSSNISLYFKFSFESIYQDI